ncbi:MAG: patatin family protein, partial [Tissierellia bacterium]|nr:patatin family protein [Tissierellia bacterium]
NGLEYLDGGLGFSGGIPIDIALKEGYKKFFIVLTREKGYKKEPMNNEILLKLHFRHQPKLLDAILTRHERYNRTLKVIEQLEKEGKAIVVRPDLMMLDSMIIDYEKAEKTYYMGYIQGMRDLDKWKKFLFN